VVSPVRNGTNIWCATPRHSKLCELNMFMLLTVGGVCYLNIMGQSFVFLSTYEAASDLLEKRAAIYSDRMQYVMATELCVPILCCNPASTHL
jgi:hypothetical protein